MSASPCPACSRSRANSLALTRTEVRCSVLACVRALLAEVAEVVVEHAAQTCSGLVVVTRVRPRRARVQDLGRHIRHMVRDVQSEDRIAVRGDVTQFALHDRAHYRARMRDRDPVADAVAATNPTSVEHPDLRVMALDAL